MWQSLLPVWKRVNADRLVEEFCILNILGQYDIII